MSSPQEKKRKRRDAIPPTKEENMSNDVFLAITPHLSPITPKGSNFAFSPLLLRTPLSLIAAGAKGRTLKQLLSFLKADSIDDVNERSLELVSSVLANFGGPKLSFANSLWIQEDLSLKHSFKHVVHNIYKASSYQADFTKGDEIVSEVNSWGEEKTNGLIKEVLPSGSVAKFTKLILANALYFKGRWADEYFKPSNTKEYEFRLLGGDSVKVPFMTSNNSRHYLGIFDGFKVLRLLYKKGVKHDERQFSMYILLPDAEDGLPALAEKVVLEPGFLDRHLPNEIEFVYEFRLPRFKISFGFEASKALKKVGLSLPFKAGGLTEMVDSIEEGKELYVSEIHHKCFIEVNEGGTEAAAFQVTRLCGGGCPPPKVDFVADHPFMFVLREDTNGAVLFFGHVLNPLEK